MADKNLQIRKHPPVGNLLLRTLAMPGDTNPAGAILAREVANGRVVTVAVDAMSFLKPVSVGDVVCCYGKCVHVGHTSMKVHLEIWVKKLIESETNEHAERHLVTEANYTYVAVDKKGKPRLLPKTAKIVAEQGIDAACIGLNEDGTVK